jgi:hypothetical protein
MQKCKGKKIRKDEPQGFADMRVASLPHLPLFFSVLLPTVTLGWFLACVVHIHILTFISAPVINIGLDNGLALTPPMGFRTWNQFGIVG